ncbi:MAG: hypothetical protein QXD34_01615 [Candidatus Bathyarchaeia archaeon]|nr:hypothetical protein [Candidatus Bathyarchaeota archaeon]
MCTRLEIPLSELKKWLENQNYSILTPVQGKAEKLLEEMRKIQRNPVEACKTLMESSRKEIDKRNARTFKWAQALNKLAKLFLEQLQQIKVLEKSFFQEC